jgi:TetR/AcrR family transcriptional regulator, cholesterol catabolism regulator
MQTGHAQTSGGKPEGKDQETRERILEVAERLFLAKGFKGVSMKDIADEVQVTTAALYYHFPEGKQDIFLSMVQRTLKKWGQQAFSKIEHVEGLHAQLVTITHTALTHPPVIHTLMRDVEEFCNDNPRRRNLMRKESLELQQRINTLFEQAAEKGEITQKVPAPLLAGMFSGIIFSLQVNRRFDVQNDLRQHDPQIMAATLVDTLFNGIKNQIGE